MSNRPLQTRLNKLKLWINIPLSSTKDYFHLKIQKYFPCYHGKSKIFTSKKKDSYFGLYYFCIVLLLFFLNVETYYLHFAIDGVLRSSGWVSRLSPMEINFPKIVRMGMGLTAKWPITNRRILPFPHLSSMEMKVTISVDIPNH